MHENLLNILSGSNKDIDNQKLMDYLSGKLNAEQQHEVEKWMADNPLYNEAIEGLQTADVNKTTEAVALLNKQLRKQLHQRKRKRQGKLSSMNTWTYIAMLLIMLLALMVYFLVRTLKS